MPPARKTTAKKAPAKRTAPRKARKPDRAGEPPVHLGVRGRALWAELHPDGTTRDPATDGLIVEACRLTDRLDRLDAILAGNPAEWLRFTLPDDGSEIVLRVDPALAEARQHATALHRLLTPLTKAAAATPAAKPEASRADELAAARAARIAAAARS